MLYFDQCGVQIGTTGILADAVSIRSANNLNPVYSVGFKNSPTQVPEGHVQTEFSLSYYIDLSKQAIFPIINSLKNLNGLYNGVTIECGGLTGFNCYLDKFNIKASPNELIKADASFISFVPLSGSFVNKPDRIQSTGFSGVLAHGWTAQMISGGNSSESKVYEFSYAFDAAWEPTFVIGNALPVQVDLMTATEKITFVRDAFQPVYFSGQDGTGMFNSTGTNINLFGYNFIADSSATSPLAVISISGTKIHSSDSEVQLDDFARATTTLYAFY